MNISSEGHQFYLREAFKIHTLSIPASLGNETGRLHWRLMSTAWGMWSKCIPLQVNSYLSSAPAWRGPVFHMRILVSEQAT